jgi:hypothetical protein
MTTPATTSATAHATTIDPSHLPSLISGRRTALVFLDTGTPVPDSVARPGDTVYLDAGQICAGACIERIETFSDLTPQDLRMLRETHGSRTVGDGSAWSTRPDARYATVVWLTETRPVLDRAGIPSGLLTHTREPWRSAEVTQTGVHRRAA